MGSSSSCCLISMRSSGVCWVGRGGPTVVARASGMSRNTVIDGAKAFDAGEGPGPRVRREGGGGPRQEDTDPNLLMDLDNLVEPDSRGDPMSPLRWTLKSTRQLAKRCRAWGTGCRAGRSPSCCT